jgi:hypothetical protein
MKLALKEPRNLYFMTPMPTKDKSDDLIKVNTIANKLNTPTSPRTLGNAFKALRYYNQHFSKKTGFSASGNNS